MRDLRLLALSLLAAACADFRSPSVPLRTIRLTPSTPGHCLAVLLPGRRSYPEEFKTTGHFDDAVTERGLPIDIIAVDAHLGYFRNRSVVDRLRADVIEPAKASGYHTIWLVGTSLGGLGSLLYLRDHPEDVSGVAVFSVSVRRAGSSRSSGRRRLARSSAEVLARASPAAQDGEPVGAFAPSLRIGGIRVAGVLC